ncbi:MAG: hypothetical protein NTU53_23360 [Planctomycetota bacterium]|nr:hypothetical protein [Planctomycetota bacterium]
MPTLWQRFKPGRWLFPAALGLLCFISAAHAEFLAPVGGPTPWHSWYQQFEDEIAGGFDRMEVAILIGGPLEIPAFGNFSVGAWREENLLPSGGGTASAAAVRTDGGAAQPVSFSLFFLGEPTEPVAFVFKAFNAGTLVEQSEVAWDTRAWSVNTTIGNCVSVVVPLPATAGSVFVTLFGIGLLRPWRSGGPRCRSHFREPTLIGALSSHSLSRV